jgi:hypothetical protein
VASCKKDKNDPVPPPPPPPPVANYEDSLKNGLWAFFDFNNGNYSDLSGKNHHMVGANGLQFGFDTWGTINNALEFDGFDDYAVIDSGKNFPEGSYTVSFLMMPQDIRGRIFQKANYFDGKAASFGFGFDQDLGTQKLHYYVSDDNNVCNTFTTTTNASILPVNKTIYPYAWYFVVLQHVNGMEKVFINGSLVASQATLNSTFKNCTTAPFYLGMWWLQDRRSFSGKIDELRIHTRALSDNEVRYLYDRLPK